MHIQKMKMDRSRKIILFFFDILCFAVIASLYYGATFIFDANSIRYDLRNYLINSAILLATMVACRLIAGIYLSIWRYGESGVYLKMILGDAASVIMAAGISYLAGVYHDVWHFVIVASLCALMMLGSRFTYRCFYQHRKRLAGGDDRHQIPVAILGAGFTGAHLADELLLGRASRYKPMFFIDCDTAKVGSRISGLKVYAESEETIKMIKEQGIQEIFIAVASLDSDLAAAIYERYRKTSCKIKIYEMPFRDAKGEESEKPRRGTLHDFRIEDLLFRKSLSINDSTSFYYYTGKKVLITGGGGSIGSELCRQIAKCKPLKLIIVDIYENNAYDIQQELIRTYGAALDLSVEIASVRDVKRLDAIFAAYRPDIVFHAAAHKHVPLMEHSSAEAIKNNVMGTYNTANMAEKYGVDKFILISTDKAVNPTNIMGASKRMCEMIVQCRTDGSTSFAAVRFGNVLGSNGSVIPLFRHQIEAGGPITITDKRIIRYFMTIPEAAQLVVEAGAMAQKGQLFVLDMGKPVRIYDLAVNMIRLCGLEPETDIKIEEIGLRPGEKLYEELLIKTERMTRTDNRMIFIETDTPLSRQEVEEKLKRLNAAVSASAHELASDAVRQALHEVVPTFREADEINKTAAASDEMKLVKNI